MTFLSLVTWPHHVSALLMQPCLMCAGFHQPHRRTLRGKLHYFLFCILCHSLLAALHVVDSSACLLLTGKLLVTAHTFLNSFSVHIWEHVCVHACGYLYDSVCVWGQRKASGVGSFLLLSLETQSPCSLAAYTRPGDCSASIYHPVVQVLGFFLGCVHKFFSEVIKGI